MSDHSTPRRMVKAWLKGEPPSRPLLMPIVFSLGARIENLSLENFQRNPTKISNALRQIRSVIEVDGLTCYFDPVLEMDALGLRREWQADGSWATSAPVVSGVDELRQKLNSPDSLEDKGLIPVACDVLRRVKAIIQDEPALMIRVSGPMAIARQLCGEPAGSTTQFLQDLVQFSSEVTACVARTFAAAGADVILLGEDFAAGLPGANFEWYSSLLAPVVNVVRFYEALPVLLLGKISQEMLHAVRVHVEDCVLCPTLTATQMALSPEPHPRLLMAYALPVEALYQEQPEFEDLLSSEVAANLSLLTSSEDVPAGLDPKKLAEGLKGLRGHFTCRPDVGRGLPHPGGPD
jgi:Uroporphyrinogen decarboxylase (URO-D)